MSHLIQQVFLVECVVAVFGERKALSGHNADVTFTFGGTGKDLMLCQSKVGIKFSWF